MSNKTIAIVLGVVVVLGGVYFGFMNKSGDSQNNTTPNTEGVVSENENTPTQENTSDRKMDFASFMKNGGSYVCTVNQLVQGIESKGTVYINDDKIHGEFYTSVAGMNVDSHFIAKDGFTYTWSSMMQGKGFKSAVSASGEANTGAGTSGQYSFNAEQIGDYDCKPWQVDSSKFALPSGVTFTLIK